MNLCVLSRTGEAPLHRGIPPPGTPVVQASWGRKWELGRAGMTLVVSLWSHAHENGCRAQAQTLEGLATAAAVFSDDSVIIMSFSYESFF